MKQRRYLGNPPGDEWEEVDLVEAEHGSWRVFVRAQDASPWISVKVCAVGYAPRKGNYWLTWSGKRFGHGHDLFKLLQHRPELGKVLEDRLWHVEAVGLI